MFLPPRVTPKPEHLLGNERIALQGLPITSRITGQLPQPSLSTRFEESVAKWKCRAPYKEFQDGGKRALNQAWAIPSPGPQVTVQLSCPGGQSCPYLTLAWSASNAQDLWKCDTLYLRLRAPPPPSRCTLSSYLSDSPLQVGTPGKPS